MKTLVLQINLLTWNIGAYVSIRKIREFFPNINLLYLNAKKYLSYITYESIFPNKLKLCSPVSNRGPPEEGELSWGEPVTVYIKRFWEIIYKQINNYVETFITGYWKSYGTQYSLITIPSKWKNNLDQSEFVSVIFMFLSENFDTSNHCLLLAKITCVCFLRQSNKPYV